MKRVLALYAFIIATTLPAKGQPLAIRKDRRDTMPRPPMAAGEVVVRLRADFPACAHCLLAQGRGLRAATGTHILDQLRLRYRIDAMEPVFGGVHAAGPRQAAQQRWRRATPDRALPDLSQTYLIHVDPRIDPLVLATDLRRDPNVVAAEPNYLYHAAGSLPHETADGLANGASTGSARTVGGSISMTHSAHPEPVEGSATRSSAVSAGEGEGTNDLPDAPFLSARTVGGAISMTHSAHPEPVEGSAARSSTVTAGEGEGTAALPDDPFLSSGGSWGQPFADLWGLFKIDAPAAWELSEGEGVVVAVIDTGLDIAHPDIAANVWRNVDEIADNGLDDDDNGFVDDVHGWDFTRCVQLRSGACAHPKPPGPDVGDPVGHGTHIAGTIAAVGDNGIGIIGVAPKAQVMVVKALDASGSGTLQDAAAAIVYAVENGATVINLSWSGPDSDTLRMAIDYATSLGATVIASAGNDAAPLERGVFPANLPEVIAVGATTHTDAAASFSNFGGPLDLVAPGGGDTQPANVANPARSVLSLLAHDSQASQVCHFEPVCTGPPDDPDCVYQEVCEPSPWVVGEHYLRDGGTSMSAPHVSGVAALVQSRHPELTGLQVRQALLQTADDLGPRGWDPHFGYGRVNARRAVEIAPLPVAQLLVPENRGKVFEWQFPFEVRGTVQAPGATLRAWQLTLVPEGSSQSTEVAYGTSAVVNGALGTLTLDPPLALGQRYTLELRVEDTDGHVATDTKSLLIPNPQFATIPVPDPFDEGGQNATISGDGTRIALLRQSGVWLFDASTRQIRRIANGGVPKLTTDGRILAYPGTLPDGSLCDPLLLSSGILYDIDQELAACLPRNVFVNAINGNGRRVAFISPLDLDPIVGNRDRSYEAFLFDVLENRVHQITSGPRAKFGDPRPEIDELALSTDGRRAAFASTSSLDSTAMTNGQVQVFLYDDVAKTVHQLSGRSPQNRFGRNPSLSADGARVAYQADGVFLVSVGDGHPEQVVPSYPYSYGAGQLSPLLSVDGERVAFVAAADLDSHVANQDLRPELFLLDLRTRSATQVTDFVGGVGASLAAMDSQGRAFVLDGAEVLGLDLSLATARAVPRRRPNHLPILTVPATLIAQEGQTARFVLKAADQDGDAITMFVQFANRARLRNFASVLSDDGSGTATLELTPRHDQSGVYPLRVAAFDEVGGVDAIDAQLIVEDTMPEGDANCNGRIDFGDSEALVRALFNSALIDECVSADANDDGSVSAADLIALDAKLALLSR